VLKRLRHRIYPRNSYARNFFIAFFLLLALFGGRESVKALEDMLPRPPSGPFGVHLTCGSDMGHQVIVHFQSVKDHGAGEVRFDAVSRKDNGRAYAYKVQSEPATLRAGYAKRSIYRIPLQGLAPDTTYYFIAGNEALGFTRERKFRTPPATCEGVRFVEGGDIGNSKVAAAMLRLAARQEPYFAVLGGDLAHANGEPYELDEWDEWFAMWDECMVTPDGYTIPFVTCIGNHETRRGTEGRPASERAPFFMRFFAEAPDHCYTSYTLGDEVVFLMLDTGYVSRFDGPQRAWLQETLALHAASRWTFAVYHEPLYPAHYDFENPEAVEGRLHWAPLFDAYGVTAAFEHHEHNHKRTYRLTGGQRGEVGTAYLGNGCIGMEPRSVKGAERGYLAQAVPARHFWKVDLTRDTVRFEAIDETGACFDEFEITRAKSIPNLAKAAHPR
jgi:hypothetical protein